MSPGRDDDGESITKTEVDRRVWKPRHARKSSDMHSENAKTEELLGAVRGILNKLTPQGEKYDKLLVKLQQLPIHTPERLSSVVKLVFDKAVNEPMFFPAYVRICQQIMSTKQASSSENFNSASFRKLLLFRCQKEFEKGGTSLVELEEKGKQLEAEENEEKKKELECALNEMKAKNRRVTLGNIRFIGELFKLRVLTPRILHSCVMRLLSASDEESLECMCRLMSTIGKDLEQTGTAAGIPSEMNSYFQKLQSMSEDKGKYSNRIRFMILDLVDLRRNDWKPRREENNPKTIDQISKNVKRERKEREYQITRTPCEPAGNMGGGGGRRGGGGGGGPGRNVDDRKRSRAGSKMSPGLADEGWSTVSKGKRNDFKQLSGWVDDGASITKVEEVWKPRHARKISELVHSEKAETEELLNAVRGILNKLTPQKYDKLLEKLQHLPIHSLDSLSSVVKLVFDKAVNEPMFSPLYARLCWSISTNCAPSNETYMETITFRKLLLNRSQKEFQRVVASLFEIEEKLQQLKVEANEGRKNDPATANSDIEAKNRRVILGFIRFIGELFNVRIVTPRIVCSCIERLLSTPDGYSLECACRLVSTVGKNLEQTHCSGGGSSGEMDLYFQRLEAISYGLSNRIRFMIQDLIELRKNHWKPRREENKPKTIAEIHTELQRERVEAWHRVSIDRSRQSLPRRGRNIQ